MVEYASNKNIDTLINTNGVLLTEQLSNEFIDARLSSMCFSFDGGKKETYEIAREGAIYEKVVKNIKYLIIFSYYIYLINNQKLVFQKH